MPQVSFPRQALALQQPARFLSLSRYCHCVHLNKLLIYQAYMLVSHTVVKVML